MNKMIISSKIALMIVFMSIMNGLSAQNERLIIKNDSEWNIKIKFAAPGRAVPANGEISMAPKGTYSMPINDMYSISNLSVLTSGYLESVSSWRALDVNELRKSSVEKIKNTAVPAGFKLDIYWNIQSTGTSWTAKMTSVSRKAQ